MSGPTAGAWSTSFPGIVMRACGDSDGAFEVHRETGRMLRIGSEAYLCFDCGPDGGVYHPDDRDGLTNDMDSVRVVAAGFDKHFNQFHLHSHHTLPGGKDGPDIQHSHTDGHEPHKHPETATAFLGHRGEGVGKPTKQPTGELRPFVALSDDERTFRVVLPYRYINPGRVQGVVRVGHRLTAREREALKPPPEWSRATWRASMEAVVWAIRYPEHYELRSRGGAIDMTVVRLGDGFGLEPIYVIPGWTPTPWQGLP